MGHVDSCSPACLGPLGCGWQDYGGPRWRSILGGRQRERMGGRAPRALLTSASFSLIPGSVRLGQEVSVAQAVRSVAVTGKRHQSSRQRPRLELRGCCEGNSKSRLHHRLAVAASSPPVEVFSAPCPGGALLSAAHWEGSGRGPGSSSTPHPLLPTPHLPSIYLQVLALLYLTDDCAHVLPKHAYPCNSSLSQSIWGGLTAVCIWFGQPLHNSTHGILASSRMKEPKA